MDTKVEQEVFGYDPNDPEGLDSLHSHIHTEWPELDEHHGGIQQGELTIIGAGRRHLEVSDAAELELRLLSNEAAGSEALSMEQQWQDSLQSNGQDTSLLATATCTEKLPSLGKRADVIILDEVEDETQPVPFKMARLSQEVKSWYACKARLSAMWVEDKY